MYQLPILETLRLRIEQEQIDHGIPGDCGDCPIALAVQPHFPRHAVSVDQDEIRLYPDATDLANSYREYHWRDREAARFINTFDNRKPVGPATLFAVRVK